MSTGENGGAIRRLFAGLPGWQKGLFVFSGVLLAVGLVLQGYGLVRGGKKLESGNRAPAVEKRGLEGPAGSDSGAARSLLPGEPGPVTPPAEPGPEGGAQAAEDEGVTAWSPAFLKGGLGFFVGFSVGYALRTLARAALFVAGAVALAVLLLSWAGFVEVHWDALSQAFDRLASGLETQFRSFHAFLQGSIPAAGLAAVGLVAGFRRR